MAADTSPDALVEVALDEFERHLTAMRLHLALLDPDARARMLGKPH